MQTTDPKSKILNLPYPVVGLAPIDGVSDAAFRRITKKYGNPDLIFTEFTHVMGLCFAAENILNTFDYDEMERPIVAQIFGKDPEYFYHAAKVICALGFDGVDINMGCPAHSVSSKGAGAGLIKTPDLAREIIYQTKLGVSDWVKDGKLTGLRPKAQRAIEKMQARNAQRITQATPLSSPLEGGKDALASKGVANLLAHDSKLVARALIPVSVKTRIGYDEPVTESWIKNLEKENPQWITVHGRTLKQMYTGSSDWSQIKIAVESTDIPVMANGDVKEHADIKRILDATGAKGTLVARGAFGNPWIFASPPAPLLKERVASASEPGEVLAVLLEHAKLFDQLNNNSEKAFVQMRKHFAWYINTITKMQGANNNDVEFFLKMKDLKMRLMQVSSSKQVEREVESFRAVER